MHLRDGESGGAAYEAAPGTASYSYGGGADPSSSRTVHIKSADISNQSSAEFLLAWILVLYRENDDSLGNVNWGYAQEARSSTSETANALDIKAVPLTKTDSLSEMLEATRRLSSSITTEQAHSQTLFFNNGVAEVNAPKHKLTQQRSHNWTYQIQVTILGQQQIEARAQWDNASFSQRIATNRLESFLEILNTIIEHPSRSIADAIGPTRADIGQIWSWNAELPPKIDRGLHEYVADNAASQPEALAIESWDGNLTYAQIETYSTRLALHLVSLGVTVGSTIPLCFEKSRWTAVALLAVMKAGAAFALTDPSQPEARLRTIYEQTQATLIITSQLQSELGRKIAGPGAISIVLTEQLVQELAPGPDVSLPQFSKDLPLYIQFTSGSTGKPKGVLCSHANYASGSIPRADIIGYRAHSRVFDFASYAFDVSIDLMLCTLVNGGCLCIPSDEDRMNDLSGAIRKSKVNMVHMTPSVARVLDDDIIQAQEVLGLGGEAVSAGDASAWSKTTKVIIAYGPSECTVGCTINGNAAVSQNIGKGTGCLLWVVDPDDHDRLMPVGAVGELLVEGPVVGLGYLNDPVKTAEVFIEDPAWLLAGGGASPGRHGRLYKTGDLVRYDADGTGAIAFVGRKDQQVKLRGQRIELAEVEHHLRGKLPASVKVVAEVIKPGGGEPSLVAFITEQTPVPSSGDNGLTQLSPELSRTIAQLDEALGAEIPRYMVPSAYIPLDKMPSLVSGKIDRKRLRELGSALSREAVARMGAYSGESTEPETELEKALQTVWIKVLGGGVQDVGRNDSFFGLGGDSLRAMKLVAAAREAGLSLTVASAFNNPVLKDMAKHATKIEGDEDHNVAPFSLIDAEWTPEAARADAAALCNLEASQIEDVYPCTPLQEALMALSAKVKEAYVAQRVVQLADAATADRFRAALDVASADSPILRTRIVQASEHGLVQVVVKGSIPWHIGTDLQKYLAEDRDDPMDLGKALARFALITDSISGKTSFVLSLHHAVYDGWSMPLTVDRMNKAFDSKKVQRPAEFKHFIKYLAATSREEAEKFWREKLDGASGPQYPPLPYPGYQTQADSLLEVRVPLPGRPASKMTVATLIRGAWAYVASTYSATSDVVFGETLTGRNAPIRGSEEIEGPMITTVPLRVQVAKEMSAVDYLQSVHDQTVEQIPYEHTGLQHIRRLSPDAYEACELRTGLVLHPSTDDEEKPSDKYPANHLVPAGDAEAAQEALKFNTYALMLVCSLDANGFLVMASFDSKTVDKTLMEKVLARFSDVAQRLCTMVDEPLGDLHISDAKEKAKLLPLSTSNKNVVAKEYPDTHSVWILDHLEQTQLAPLGAFGELVIASTADLSHPVLEEPGWLVFANGHLESQPPLRFYKTGRHARFGPDGVLKLADSRKVSQAPAAPTKRISATSGKQRRLRALWSKVLKLPESGIGLNDNFFRLGGDSITAMKLVSEARLDGFLLGVTQIFQNRSLYDMSSVLEDIKPESTSEVTVKPPSPFELIQKQAAAAFVASSIQPALADKSWKVLDVLPVRPLQEVAIRGTMQLPRFSARYEAMYFDGPVDRARLFKACQGLVSGNEILRTVFVPHGDTFLAAVLEDLPTPVVEYETDGDVTSFVHALTALDVQTRMGPGSAFVKWFFVSSTNGTSALIFRVSHAQYDEICLPLMLRQLSALYENKPLPPSVPFSAFVGHVLSTAIPSSVGYWRDLLAGSSLDTSVLKVETPVVDRAHFAVERAIDISHRSKDMTTATLPTAAWALTLARRLNRRDVVFGEVVSGRNTSFPSSSAVVGPCWQYIPFRALFPPGTTAASFLAQVQEQHIASAAHESLGLPEIAALCCPHWAPGTYDWFDTVVHQDVEHVASLPFEAASTTSMETIYPHSEPLREWKIQAFPAGDTLTIEVVTFQSWEAEARALLDDIVDSMTLLVTQPGAILFE
ncbi:surfactin synthetase subunit 3 [Plectosphaerella cucumerina]|uniref:Surfactin synthetase subunit 3 n=1 Tax=Plectosphaerella cucumerina TaxID=40658 RepID=A0A8K0TGV0_9PEZI|nr:surfactin synthetase subunit 3 [Plectosphaerella cucumerina]